jgi:hypothetical protein
MMSTTDRLLGSASSVALILLAYWGGMHDWRLTILGAASICSYQLAWTRGRKIRPET